MLTGRCFVMTFMRTGRVVITFMSLCNGSKENLFLILLCAAPRDFPCKHKRLTKHPRPACYVLTKQHGRRQTACGSRVLPNQSTRSACYVLTKQYDRCQICLREPRPPDIISITFSTPDRCPQYPRAFCAAPPFGLSARLLPRS